MRRMILFLLTLFFALSAAGCGKTRPAAAAAILDEGLPLSEMEHPPFLTLASGNEEVRALSPNCFWNRPDGTAFEADGPFVFELWLEGDMELLKAAPGSNVELRFGCAPDRFTVTAWKAECASFDHARYEEKTEVPVLDGTFSLLPGGPYLYELSAEWDIQGKAGGRAVYAFAAELSE